MGSCCGKEQQGRGPADRSNLERAGGGRGEIGSVESKEKRRQRIQQLNMSSLVHTVIDKVRLI